MDTTSLQNTLRTLKLDGMAEAFEQLVAQNGSRSVDPVKWIEIMALSEEQARSERRFQSRLRSAKLRDTEANVANVDYTTMRQLDEPRFRELAQCNWIKENSSVLITGPCGVGKSYLACALGHEACRQEKSVLYFRMPRFFSELEAARKAETYERLFKKIIRTDVLILDDWGPDLMTAAQRRDLMEIVDARYDNKATIITSQLPVEKWYDVIADPTFADAILDRLVHRSHRIALDGPSMRKVNSVTTPRKPSFSRILQEQRQASPA
ncbi:IS21-like element helper ATPase IstB [Planktotalea sp.]|uniref:IS21-like element helper ATPase IstB n=1 Tax=Planktotalea sp. TaxID=2029877 RepID=UPI003F6D2485